MKIRIKGNSIRYRLTKSEVEKLWKEGCLEEQTGFADNTFVYAIETGSDNKLSAGFNDGKIVLHVPRQMIDDLYNTDKVGFDDRSGTVSLLIEKDFACIDNTDEDQSDNYDNPNLA